MRKKELWCLREAGASNKHDDTAKTYRAIADRQ
jgi:hypothetical protein